MSIDLEKLNDEDNTTDIDQEVKNSSSFLHKLQSIATVSSKDKIFFVQNLQVMIRSGLALDRSLKTLAEQTRNKKFKNIINDLSQQTERGISFTDCLKKHERVFGDLFISMVEAGEVSGKLEDVLNQIYVQIKKMHELKSKVMAAMIYPLIVVIAMICIGIGMMVFVVPKITGLFDQMEAELPFATRALIGISDFIIHNGIIVSILTIGLIVLVVSTLRWEKTKIYYHAFFLRLPIIGKIIKKINLAKFARTFSSLIKTDIPIVKSFEITAHVLGNASYKTSLLNSMDDINSGKSLTDVLNNYPHLYPPVIVQMTSAGEETGTVDDILGELASFYEDEIDQIMKTLPSIIEPLLILILGVGVAAIALAIIMPMYSLTQHIS